MEMETPENISPLINAKCLQTSCAWWVTKENKCSIIGITQVLSSQANIIRDMLNINTQVR